MVDPYIRAKAHAHRHLARNDLNHRIKRLRTLLGLPEPRRRDHLGRFTKAGR